MNGQSYLTFARPLPESLLLVCSEAVVLDVNPSTERMLEQGADALRGLSLTSLVADPAPKVHQFIKRCAGSGSLVPTTLSFHMANKQIAACRCEGALAQPPSRGDQPLILLRCAPKTDAANRFLVLNQKTQELAQEVKVRRRAEEALRHANETLEQSVKERTEQMVTSEALTRAMMDNIAEAIVTIDEHGSVESFNAAAEDIFGYTGFEMMGENVNILMPPPYHDEHDDYIKTYLETGQKHILGNRREVIGRRKDGSTFPADLHVSEMHFGSRRLFIGIVRDLTEAKEAERQLETINKQLRDASHQAGMAEVASGVLHNVGNVLNSVNLSVGQITRAMRNSQTKNLAAVSSMVQQHTDDFVQFVCEDERGKLLPKVLVELSSLMDQEQEHILEEVRSLADNIEHIKQIVIMQQTYAMTSSVIDPVPASQLVEDALKINTRALDRHQVQVACQYDSNPTLTTDRHRVMQILVNLISNAKYAMDHQGDTERLLTLRIATVNDDRVHFEVQDTGSGIAPENMTKIFTHGFTTRKNGHGFGLHSAALAAGEMGGSLKAHSDGPGKGAVFTLELPIELSAGVTP